MATSVFRGSQHSPTLPPGSLPLTVPHNLFLLAWQRERPRGQYLRKSPTLELGHWHALCPSLDRPTWRERALAEGLHGLGSLPALLRNLKPLSLFPQCSEESETSSFWAVSSDAAKNRLGQSCILERDGQSGDK